MKNRRPRILMYHGICKFANDPNETCTSPALFRTQMRYLKARNLRGVSLRELRRAEARGDVRGLIGLTFDDGYEDFLQAALPILEEFGFTATVFVVSGMLGRENEWKHFHEPKPRLRLLGAEGVREIAARGIEVGSHSSSHPELSLLKPESLEKELVESRRVLGGLLERPVEGFCYPYGNLNAAVVRAVRDAGYDYACAVNGEGRWDEYTLPRIPVSERDSLPRFAAKVEIYWQYRAVKTRLLRTSG